MLTSKWQDSSFSTTVNYANADPVHTGSNSIAVTFTNSWAAFTIAYGGATIDARSSGTLRFWANGGTSGGQLLRVIVSSSSQTNDVDYLTVPPLQANTWIQVDIPLSKLIVPKVYKIAFFNNSASIQPVFYVDDISLIGAAVPGDANGDGAVNALDLVSIVGEILGTSTATGTPDCNQDQTVNALDLVCTVGKILGG